MPKDAPVNTGATSEEPIGPHRRVSEMQAKLHRWAAADPGRRFDDLFNLVHDPATLLIAFERVAGNTGANTPGVDGLTVALVEELIGAPGFLDDLRTALKAGTSRPLPVRERTIPKPGGSGKVRRLGIPTIADRVVQAALKLVLEPVFEADFLPVSYGFRPRRRAHDAIAEIHLCGTHGYRWVLDADIEACFDSIDHTALMDRVRDTPAASPSTYRNTGPGSTPGCDCSPPLTRRRPPDRLHATHGGQSGQPILGHIGREAGNFRSGAAVAVSVGDLRQRHVQHRDVVGGVV
jgi:RNA-directed DNA polymerase